MAAAVLTMSVVAVGCAQESPEAYGDEEIGAATAALVPALNTFIPDSIEVDVLGGGPGDSNLVVGPDPADGTASAQLPGGGPGSYIDWQDLGATPESLANHRVLDLNNASGKDESSFPQKNECVGTSSVLSKMDLTYVAFANNNQFAYFGVQRSNNNGDAGYYWLFTRKPPSMDPGAGPCKPDHSRLTYNLSGPSGGASGDVLLAGHFHPGDDALLKVYQAQADRNGVPAGDAINFNDASLWQEAPGAVSAAAVNTTLTAPGAFGAAGVLALDGGNLEPELFAEAAVAISIFTGSSPCGATFYGSVITRSSGAGGTSPDLKDLAGPALFNFGGVDASATLTPTCGLAADYSASATGFDGQPLVRPTCSWDFGGGVTSSDCSGSQALAAGTHNATVTVTDPVSGCSDTATTADVELCPPLSVVADLTATCTSSFGFDATPSGGCGSVGYAWTFSGGGTTSPDSSSSKSGGVAVGTPGVPYTGSVTVTDTRTDIECTASHSDMATPFAPLVVSLSPSATNLQCPTDTDAITYSAVVSGGSGAVSGYAWNTLAKQPVSLPDLLCAGASCVIDPADGDFCVDYQLSVTVTDANPLCGQDTSEAEDYQKRTSVTSTNQT